MRWEFKVLYAGVIVLWEPDRDILSTCISVISARRRTLGPCDGVKATLNARPASDWRQDILLAN